MAKKKEEGAAYKVVAPFRNKDNWDDEYLVGQDVSDLGDERLLDLIEKGLVAEDKEEA